MATARASWTGQEAWIRLTPLASRLSAALQDQGYQVKDLVADRGLFSLEFSASCAIETGVLPAVTDVLREAIRVATIQATGNPPTAIAITSAGEPAPGGGAGSSPLSWIEQLAATLKTTTQVVLWLIVAGVAFVIYTVGKHPGLVLG